MIYIVDTNVLTRLADASDPMHDTTQNASTSLRANRITIRTFPQAIYEFWAVATRPLGKNGLGLSIAETETIADIFINTYWPLPDDPATLTYWRLLVARYEVAGKQAHDARYVASMQAHGLTHLLTFDSDFKR